MKVRTLLKSMPALPCFSCVNNNVSMFYHQRKDICFYLIDKTLCENLKSSLPAHQITILFPHWIHTRYGTIWFWRLDKISKKKLGIKTAVASR